ncbi:MAG TPA: hypothetical protein VMU79_04965 [Casimicrobiaceae bacterium]|nr:hypothetical protein [Casimicrobiaceae bacterium]
MSANITVALSTHAGRENFLIAERSERRVYTRRAAKQWNGRRLGGGA